jgi:hypothetical protein
MEAHLRDIEERRSSAIDYECSPGRRPQLRTISLAAAQGHASADDELVPE